MFATTCAPPQRKALTATLRQVKRRRQTLAGLSTTSPKQRTKAGARVGSSAAALRVKVSGLDCSNVQGERWCTLGIDLPLGSPQTIFVLRHGRVREVRILLTFP